MNITDIHRTHAFKVGPFGIGIRIDREPWQTTRALIFKVGAYHFTIAIRIDRP